MSYMDAMVTAVPTARKADYLAHAQAVIPIMKEFGAERFIEGWGDDVPTGKLTDFFRAVQATEGETVVVSWIMWPDKATRDAGWAKIMEDPRLAAMEMPFDGKRMIWGGFEPILEA
jgi:uncharacterized protein YbaA (DUF1428 family)